MPYLDRSHDSCLHPGHLAAPQARQLEVAQLGSQRTEEQLVALSTQLSAAQEAAHEAAEAELAAAREAANGEVAQAQAAAEEARAELARVQAELAALQEGGFAHIVSGAGAELELLLHGMHLWGCIA